MQTTLGFYVSLIVIVFPLCAFGQQGIFEYVEERAANLRSEQVELLETWRSKPQVLSTYLVIVADVSEIGAKDHLFLNLPGKKVLTVGRTFKELTQQDQIRWGGTIVDADAEVRLLISEEGVTGMIRSKQFNYDIHPLRDSEFHLLLEIDPAGFERELPPLRHGDIDNTHMPEKDSHNQGVNAVLSNPEIRVMVVYTTNAKNNHPGNINNMITLAVGNMIDAFTTSGVNADVSLVHTAEISYTESSNSLLNLCRLTTSQTFTPGHDCSVFSSGQLEGHMNQIHDWRYQHDAHLVVLVTGSGGPGIGWMPASNNLAFSIARHDVAASNYTLAHEIGHNLGAHHDPDNAQEPPPIYPYAHGYIYHPGEWATIMAYPPAGYTRINRYSTPLKTFAGEPTGTAELHDNARAMNNRVSSVANFNPPAPPTPALSVALTGSTFLSANETGNWSATTSGGEGSTWNFKWYTCDNGLSCTLRRNVNLSVNSDAFSYAWSVTGDHWVQVEATRGAETAWDSHVVHVSSGSCEPWEPCRIAHPGVDGIADAIPDDYILQGNYPNPFNPSTEIRFGLPERAEVTLVVYDVTGKEVANLVNGSHSAGYHRVTWDASGLPSGIYLYRLTANDFAETGRMALVK